MFKKENRSTLPKGTNSPPSTQKVQNKAANAMHPKPEVSNPMGRQKKQTDDSNIQAFGIPTPGSKKKTKEKSIEVKFLKEVTATQQRAFLDRFIAELNEFTGYKIVEEQVKNGKYILKLTTSQTGGTSSTAADILEKGLDKDNTLKLFVGTSEDLQNKSAAFDAQGSFYYKNKIYMDIDRLTEQQTLARNEDNLIQIVNKSGDGSKMISKDQEKFLRSRFQMVSIDLTSAINAGESVLDNKSILEHYETVGAKLISQKTTGPALEYLHELLHFLDPKAEHTNKVGHTDDHIEKINNIREEHESNSADIMGKRIQHFGSTLSGFIEYYESIKNWKEEYGKLHPEQQQYFDDNKDAYQVALDLIENGFDYNYQIWEHGGKLYFLYPK